MVKARLPAPPTPLIGRDKELGDVVQRVADPACRLLTLLGPGGIGKTRLALQAAIEGEAQFAEGACFVDLQPLESANFLPVAIADALELPLSGQQEPETQLKNYLRGREMLLVLDNFEHLLPAGVNVIGRILAGAPDVTLLVTSREALNLREEWLYPLGGLPFPTNDREKDAGDYGAVQLFTERAHRVQPDFSLDEERRAVVRICRLVEGMPLALELAASWMRVLNCAAIADQIQEDVAFLTSSVRNVPDKHRSMQAVFDHSWRLLSEGEQDAYKRLSVFRGGFTLKAAEAVAGASLPVLSTLANKSLLRPGEDGRYYLHELLRQYAEERLGQSAAEAAQVRRLHCDYYVDLLSRHGEDFKGGRQQEAVARIERDRENVRAAWQRAVKQKRVPAMRKALYPFAYFAEFKGRYAEIVGALERALTGLEEVPAGRERDRALAEVLVLLGWSYIRVGRHGKAQAVLERGRAIYQQLEAAPPDVLATDPLLGLAILAIIAGDYERALSLAEEGLRLSEERGDAHNQQLAFYALSSATLAQGKYERARRYARQAYDVTQETGNEWFRAYVLNELGQVAQALGQYDQARQHFEASYAIKESFNDPEGQGVALNHMGAVAWRQRDLEKAGELYRRSVAIYREISDRGGLATALNGLGNTALARGDLTSARRRLRQALDIAADIHYVPLILSVLAAVGELLLRAGKTRRGVELLTLVEGHPAGEEETKERARRCLEWAGETPERPDQQPPEGPADLIARCQTVLDEVAALKLPDEDEREREEGDRFISPPGQRLAEPLTERELEVLQHIAQGLTNQEVADELVISVGTVKWYTSQIYGKLDVGNRTAAVARARELGLLR
ncbi:MAG: tetratricopeptide repeat protein [Candidatus Promineifilaceae bacterium]|nr:tetratricopeptide repeat protein [Candidatus Promineifilaceae bacterium]